MLLWSNFKKVSESLEKALKQQNTETGKRKWREKRVNFSSSDDEDDQVEEVEPDDSFVCELDQFIRTRKNLLFDRKYVVRYHGIFFFFTWFSTSSKSY